MAGKVIEKGWVVPPALGVALIVVMLTSVGALYWRMSDRVEDANRSIRDQRDAIIRMETMLNERTSAAEKIELKRSQEEKQNQDENRIWRETMKDRMVKLEYSKGK